MPRQNIRSIRGTAVVLDDKNFENFEPDSENLPSSRTRLFGDPVRPHRVGWPLRFSIIRSGSFHVNQYNIAAGIVVTVAGTRT